MVQKIRKKNYFLSIANHVRKKVRECQTCVPDTRRDNSRITPKLINILEWGLGPEEVKPIDIQAELPPSGGYQNNITALDVF